jgi:GntR family transcriptional regulator
MDGQSWHSSSGDYVRPRDPGQRDAWTEEAAQQGKMGSQQLLQVAEVSPQDHVRDALGLAHDEQVVLRRRLVLLDDAPVELTDSYYPASLARGTALAEFRKIRGGAVTALAEIGHVPRFVSESVHARKATAEERELLGSTDELAVLVLFRVTMDEEGRPIEAAVMVIADGRHVHYELAT